MKPYELIDGGLYKVGDKVVKYDFTFHSLNDGKHQYAFSRSGMGDVMVVTPITFTIAYLSPIPLTAEILEKNGFEYNTYNRWMSGRYGVALMEKDEYLFIWDRIQINYIHELQLALRLCGLNELADNFKV